IGHAAKPILQRTSVHDAPDVRVERTVLALNFEERARVDHRRSHLQAVAYDTGILEQPRDVPFREARDSRGIEIAKCIAVGLALLENREPRQPGLGAVE